ncbi:high mobility group box domain-containing protein [Catenaria anguillulae PL171]|uniref:High mobility group box domain-containing protein n=1 Tax=Catenaria anguillulae PL171 TaxID=765915 RepID=A0A1Y2I0E0_9FUNG|nr:high mobility group box domain-containing protein [Catenaria anguillulae PL171]
MGQPHDRSRHHFLRRPQQQTAPTTLHFTFPNMPKAAKDSSPPPKTRRPRATKKAAKDPNKPKRPMTAFFIFSGEHRDEVKKANPDLKVGQIAKVLGERWRALSDAEKAKYQVKVDAEKKRYDAEMEAYNAAGGAAAAAHEDEEEDDE